MDTNVNVRLAVLKARCTPVAREYLDEFVESPSFSEVLTYLEQFNGQIFRMHVEAAVADVVNGRQQKPQ
jgi:hypothetical protein